MTLPPPDPRLRAGDGDRDAVAEQLREAHAEGRLTMEELEDRLGKTYAARTFADLAPLTADLPPRPFGASVPRSAEVARPLPTNVRAPRRDAQSGSWIDSGLRASWYAWATAVSVTVVIWLIITLTSGIHYFWPIWVAGPWGAVLTMATLSRRADNRRRLPPGSGR
ncbi:MAG TPA: DUF1707 domain-containing protein [Actinomycetes bacterium]|nr:DUF1707 domain-containing protein [Actinomycetes bacterium]